MILCLDWNKVINIIFPTIVENYYRQKKKNIIITLCMNGEGGAIQIKKYLEDSLELQDIDIFHYQ